MTTSHEQLMQAIRHETEKFQECYLWLEKAMPKLFFEETEHESLMLVTHNLMGFHLQQYFSTIHLRGAAITLCLDSADADLRILKNYELYGIKNYQTYVSNTPPPFPGVTANLRIAVIYFTEAIDDSPKAYSNESKEELRALVKQRNPHLSDKEFDELIGSINNRFLRSMPTDGMILALDMFFRAKTRDNCQYEVRYNENWQATGAPSMQIVLAWRNAPKHNFLYRLARTIQRHNLVMHRVNAAYVDPYSMQNVLLMTLGLHGSDGRAAWEVANIPDFLRELVTVKYFASFDQIDEELVNKGVVTGNMGNVLRAMVNFCHQSLVYIDPNIYTIEHCEEALCRHPELTVQLIEAFEMKFNPETHNLDRYIELRRTSSTTSTASTPARKSMTRAEKTSCVRR